MLLQAAMANEQTSDNLGSTEAWSYRLVRAAAIGVVHYLLVRLSLSFITDPEGISVFWLPEGFLIAALAVLPKRDWIPALAFVYGLGVFGEWESRAVGLQIWLLPIVNFVEGVIGALLLRRAVPDPMQEFDVRSMAWMIIGAGLVPSVVGGLFGATIVWSTAQGASFFAIWRIWAAATFVGTLMTLPFTLGILKLAGGDRIWSWKRRIELATLLAITAFLAEILFGLQPTQATIYGPVLYTFFPLFLWAALRFGTLGASLVLFVMALIVVTDTTEGMGPFAFMADDTTRRVLLMQSFLIVAACSTQILAAISGEREASAGRIAIAEQRYRSLVDQAFDGIFLADQNGVCIEANPAACRMMGYERDELIGRHAEELIDPEDLARVPSRMAQVQRGIGFVSERVLLRKDGTRLPVEISARPLPDGRIIGICRDLTERHSQQSILRTLVSGTASETGEAFFHSLVSNLAEGLGVRCAFVAEMASPKSLRTLSIWSDGKHHANRTFDTAGTASAIAIEQGKLVVMEQARREFPSDSLLKEMTGESFVGAAILDSGGTKVGLLAFLDDKPLGGIEPAISILSIFAARAGAELDRLRGEHAVKQSEGRLNALLQAIPDTLFVMTLDGVYVDYRTQDPSRLRAAPVEFIGKSFREVMPAELVPEFEKAFTALRKGKAPKVIEYASSLFGEERHYEVRHSNVGDGLVLAILRDVTQRKEYDAEITRLNENLERLVEDRTSQLQDANQELESFAYAVSHDLRAPLRAIHANAEILREDMEGRATPEDIVSLDRVAARAEEMSGLIDGLLKLSRIMRAELKREKIDLSSTAHTIAEGLTRSAPDRKVEFVIQDGLTAEGDGALLSAVLGNLLENAFKFSSKKDVATIEFGVMKERRKTTYFVRDNGAGFDPKHSSKLFGPFERLHAHGEFGGTGIGLATVHRIVRRHGGEIWAVGEVEKGATFYFTLPEQAPDSILEGKSGSARQ